MDEKKTGLLEQGFWEESKKPGEIALDTSPIIPWKVRIPRPSFFKRPSGPPQKLRPTAYLDGLRGFAAFIVYWHHHILWIHDATANNHIFENQFGYDGNYYFACLPFVRTFFSGGHYAVTVFFVISGYVLSTKPLSLIHAGDFNKLSENVGSALFRRWLRLYIPLIGTTFIYMTCWHLFGFYTQATKPQETWLKEVWTWYLEFKQFAFVFRQGGEPWFTYNFHSWSIPVEFKGSIVIYTTLLAFSRCTKIARLWCMCGLMFYFMYIVDGWYCSMFVGGMFLCELDILAKAGELPKFFYRLQPWKDFIFYHMLIVSIYLGGVPSQTYDIKHIKNARGWYYLSFLKPKAVYDYKWFFLFWAAMTLVACIPRIPWLKRFFECRFCQYLGRISFSLYLVHGPVLWSIGDRIYVACGWSKELHLTTLPNWVGLFPLSKAGPLGMEFAELVPQIILLPLTFWLAEMVTRTMDEPSVRFAAWFYKQTLPEPEDHSRGLTKQ